MIPRINLILLGFPSIPPSSNFDPATASSPSSSQENLLFSKYSQPSNQSTTTSTTSAGAARRVLMALDYNAQTDKKAPIPTIYDLLMRAGKKYLQNDPTVSECLKRFRNHYKRISSAEKSSSFVKPSLTVYSNPPDFALVGLESSLEVLRDGDTLLVVWSMVDDTPLQKQFLPSTQKSVPSAYSHEQVDVFGVIAASGGIHNQGKQGWSGPNLRVGETVHTERVDPKFKTEEEPDAESTRISTTQSEPPPTNESSQPPEPSEYIPSTTTTSRATTPKPSKQAPTTSKKPSKPSTPRTPTSKKPHHHPQSTTSLSTSIKSNPSPPQTSFSSLRIDGIGLLKGDTTYSDTASESSSSLSSDTDSPAPAPAAKSTSESVKSFTESMKEASTHLVGMLDALSDGIEVVQKATTTGGGGGSQSSGVRDRSVSSEFTVHTADGFKGSVGTVGRVSYGGSEKASESVVSSPVGQGGSSYGSGRKSSSVTESKHPSTASYGSSSQQQQHNEGIIGKIASLAHSIAGSPEHTSSSEPSHHPSQQTKQSNTDIHQSVASKSSETGSHTAGSFIESITSKASSLYSKSESFHSGRSEQPHTDPQHVSESLRDVKTKSSVHSVASKASDAGSHQSGGGFMDKMVSFSESVVSKVSDSVHSGTHHGSTRSIESNNYSQAALNATRESTSTIRGLENFVKEVSPTLAAISNVLQGPESHAKIPSKQEHGATSSGTLSVPRDSATTNRESTSTIRGLETFVEETSPAVAVISRELQPLSKNSDSTNTLKSVDKMRSKPDLANLPFPNILKSSGKLSDPVKQSTDKISDPPKPHTSQNFQQPPGPPLNWHPPPPPESQPRDSSHSTAQTFQQPPGPPPNWHPPPQTSQPRDSSHSTVNTEKSPTKSTTSLAEKLSHFAESTSSKLSALSQTFTSPTSKKSTSSLNTTTDPKTSSPSSSPSSPEKQNHTSNNSLAHKFAEFKESLTHSKQSLTTTATTASHQPSPTPSTHSPGTDDVNLFRPESQDFAYSPEVVTASYQNMFKTEGGISTDELSQISKGTGASVKESSAGGGEGDETPKAKRKGSGDVHSSRQSVGSVGKKEVHRSSKLELAEKRRSSGNIVKSAERSRASSVLSTSSSVTGSTYSASRRSSKSTVKEPKLPEKFKPITVPNPAHGSSGKLKRPGKGRANDDSQSDTSSVSNNR
ncbi:hypothetical protein BCR33DRAFT_768654 [Rhizoclosmatium globosum]|uniref:Uncharacterized protein n=1 Tax=Rhizoclosmatium globosum TaxID=329046 RepID=A0A1Y2BX19_9FUNG|nr:hypothetical protein BCR33DRAFT_768654 [Rhizoclosmatium globosum]|eukprot:ORY39288.1 hypothetical protein BCR33DRAFT_768654 [Rhizoclosmatium globosum]